MSAQWDEKGGWMFTIAKPGDDDIAMRALIEAQFDAEVDADNFAWAEARVQEINATKACRTLCLIRTASFFTDVALIALLLPWKQVKRRVRLQRDMMKFLLGRIDYKAVIKSISVNG